MRPINLREYEKLAESRLEPAAWAYYAGGADDEVTLRENESAFRKLRLRPRVLVDVSAIRTHTTLLETPVSMPIFVAPTAGQGMAHEDGECATARAAASAETLMVVSSSATRDLKEIAASCAGPKWFQPYVRHWDEAERMVKDADFAGYSAIVLTVDLPRMGNRERDNRDDRKSRLFATPNYTDRQEGTQLPSLTWKSLETIRKWSALPIVLKGIHTSDDAELAAKHGIEALVVSNHGGRQLDSAIASIDALPEVVKSAQCEVYVDGGIRRGTDILKALALGARAVLVGRPILWGLAVEGEAGVRHVLDILRGELETAMALAGCPDLQSIKPTLVTRILDVNTF